MADKSKIGERLIVRLIDEYARTDPTRIWALIPVDNDDISKGFQEIDYRQFANAINHATWWLKEKFAALDHDPYTIAYAGPKDLRYPIIAAAVCKLGKRILLCSPFATVESQHHLLDSTEVGIYFHAKELGSQLRSVLGEATSIRSEEVPEQYSWIFSDAAAVYPYNKTWEEAQADPWIIFHSSGTTGLPKPLVYTNWMLTQLDAADLMTDKLQETLSDTLRNKRYYVSLPTLHVVGMAAALEMTVFLKMQLVFGPPNAQAPNQIVQILQKSKAEGTIMAPGQIEAVSLESNGLNALRGLAYVFFAGAPLPKETAEKLTGHCKVVPLLGTTECGAYFLDYRDDDAWEYYRFREPMGMEMRLRQDNMYEAVFKRQLKFERWQQIFHLYPHLDEYPTKDLWTQHPVKKDCWRFAGRTDDLVNLIHGESLFTTPLEAIIQQHPKVRSAVVGGEGKTRPFVLIELDSAQLALNGDRAHKVAEIWPWIEQANERCADVVKFAPERIIFTLPTKPLPRSDKGSVLRRHALREYEAEINGLYK